jgi:hypothetical protein
MNAFRRLLPFLVLSLVLGALRAAEPPTGDARIMAYGIQVNGQPVRMAFDSGSEVNVLFRQVAERLRLKITEPAPDATVSPGRTRAGVTDPVKLQFGNKTWTDRLAVVDVPAGVQMDVDGVVGWGPLRGNFFRFDAAKSHLHIDRKGKPPKPAAMWQAIALQKKYAVLVLETALQNAQPGGILIDTGFPGAVTLSPARWREWRATHPTAPTTMDAYFSPADGLVVREVSWASELVIGPLTLTNVTVQEASSVEAALIPGHEATFGVGVLKRQDVVVDGKNGVAYFSRRQRPASPVQHNRLGAVFTPSDLEHDPLEAHVVAGSPAELAGIRNGDVLLKVDALDVTKWRTDLAVSTGTFWRRPAGTKFALTLKRSDAEITVTVTLRDILGPDVALQSPAP